MFIRYEHPIAPLIWVPGSCRLQPFDARPARRDVRLRAPSDEALPRKHDPTTSPEREQ